MSLELTGLSPSYEIMHDLNVLIVFSAPHGSKTAGILIDRFSGKRKVKAGIQRLSWSFLSVFSGTIATATVAWSVVRGAVESEPSFYSYKFTISCIWFKLCRLFNVVRQLSLCTSCLHWMKVFGTLIDRWYICVRDCFWWLADPKAAVRLEVVKSRQLPIIDRTGIFKTGKDVYKPTHFPYSIMCSN